MIEFRDVSKTFHRLVLNNINLTVNSGEFFVIVGSSGCGKTTLLKTVNKLCDIDSGDVLINRTSVKDIKVKDIPELIGYVVQDGGLFPHLTVEDNISIILKMRNKDKKIVSERLKELFSLVDLDPRTTRRKYPSQISGGQRQRVGIARALANDPEILLMDEPFSALDPNTKLKLQDEMLKLQEKLHKTIIFITHDMEEAVKLADRICVIGDYGEIEQCDTPEELLKHQKTDYVKSFFRDKELKKGGRQNELLIK